jgi:hypothetical protein
MKWKNSPGSNSVSEFVLLSCTRMAKECGIERIAGGEVSWTFSLGSGEIQSFEVIVDHGIGMTQFVLALQSPPSSLWCWRRDRKGMAFSNFIYNGSHHYLVFLYIYDSIWRIIDMGKLFQLFVGALYTILLQTFSSWGTVSFLVIPSEEARNSSSSFITIVAIMSITA